MKRHGVWVGCLVCLGLVGCGGSGPAPDSKADGPAAGEEKKAADPKASSRDAGEEKTEKMGKSAVVSDAERKRLHQSFARATRSAEDPPAECNRPPDLTITNKPVFKIYDQVVNGWDKVRFVDAGGRPLKYTATLDTELGEVVIALRPDLAPNHVRNFIALARAGYYDGLVFDRIAHQESEADPELKLEMVQAGCPLGTGDPGDGHLGYWLRPEFPPADAGVTHEPGTVGACRGMEADTAACRFYITLNRAPFLDGHYTVFGKVVRGLDVVRKISLQPLIIHPEDPDELCRPQKPVVIRKVTISAE
jgi:cyclophilin family peptidyl-prolyl cis-trans isomerase